MIRKPTTLRLPITARRAPARSSASAGASNAKSPSLLAPAATRGDGSREWVRRYSRRLQKQARPESPPHPPRLSSPNPASSPVQSGAVGV
jgi:hypothetical protein